MTPNRHLNHHDTDTLSLTDVFLVDSSDVRRTMSSPEIQHSGSITRKREPSEDDIPNSLPKIANKKNSKTAENSNSNVI